MEGRRESLEQFAEGGIRPVLFWKMFEQLGIKLAKSLDTVIDSFWKKRNGRKDL